jgi:hypothetical protein
MYLNKTLKNISAAISKEQIKAGIFVLSKMIRTSIESYV